MSGKKRYKALITIAKTNILTVEEQKELIQLHNKFKKKWKN